MSSQIDRIMYLAERGWKVYEGRVSAALYEKLQCPAPVFGKWLFEGDKAKELACVGCDKYCRVDSSADFAPQPRHIADMNRRGSYYTLSPQEMVGRLSLLRIDQVSYCLNISDRTVRDWIDTGKLRRTEDYPIRVPAEDVAFLMSDFDE